jgi:two-component system, OmpR family, phosphate regulon sensor histidine kinase PhoR
MKLSNLGIQIFATSIAIVLFSLVIVSWYASELGQDFYLQKTEEGLINEAKLISRILDDSLLSHPSEKLQKTIDQISEGLSIRITIIQPDGLVIADSDEDYRIMENHRSRPEVVASMDNGIGKSVRFSHTVKRMLMYVSLYQKTETRDIFIRTSQSLSIIEKTISSLQSKIFLLGLVMIIVSIFVGFIVSGRITRPLEKILDGVKYFEKGDFTKKLKRPKSREMAQLVDSLNKMAAEIDEQIQTITHQKGEQNAVLESMAEGVIAIDVNGNILRMNKTSTRLFDIEKKKKYKGHYIRKVINNVQIENLFLSVLKNGKPRDEEIKLSGQQEHHLKVSVRVLVDDNNFTIGAVMVLNDLTRLRHLEQGRREFVANVSHELRTPLTSIQGFAEALNDGALKDKKNARKFVDIIHRQANRLGNILEDILTLSRLDRGDDLTEIDFVECNILPVIESAVELCHFIAEKKKIKLINKCEGDYSININQQLIEEALINLIDNAIKYSPEKSRVIINCHSGKKHVVIDIIDEGPGIDKEHLPRIFERFYRVDKARSRNMGGTGLGLAIVKHIAQIHGGKTLVKSEIDHGSTFSLYLPQSTD